MLTFFPDTAHQLAVVWPNYRLLPPALLTCVYYFSGHISRSDAALCLSAPSFPAPLPPPPPASPRPPSVSSRNWSGSGSCRSMEIWVRTVYVIVASINALLICSGLQPSIHIIHTHTQCYANIHTHTHAPAPPTLGLRNYIKKNKPKTPKPYRDGSRKDNKQTAGPLPCLCLASASDHQSIDRL